MTQIGRHPRNGALRFSYDLNIPGLRTWPIRHFPYLVFYVETDGGIDVWRVLHTRRGLGSALAEE
jgi:toxin ParE1/3/4